MRATATATSRFSASHLIQDHSTCGRLHGHTWTISVTVEGPISPKTGAVVDAGELAFALTKLCAELDHRDLNVMLPAVTPNPEGVALWARERLLLSFPQIVSVTVSIEDYSARVEWPLR